MTTYQPPGSRSGFGWKRAVSWAAFAVVASALVLAVLFAWDGWKLNSAASELKAHAAGAQDALTSGDAEGLAAEVADLQRASDSFASHTDGPQWWVASRLPWVSSQAVPLQQAGAAVRDVAQGALKPLAELGGLGALEAPAIQDGRIDPYVLEPYRLALAQASGVLAQERETLHGVSLEGAVSQVRDPFLKLTADLDRLGETIQDAHVAAEVLPSMLGAEGPQTYIVMVQNSAEPRATGGIAGAVLEIKADDGRLAFERYSTADAMTDRDQDVAALTDDELRIFTSRMAHFPQDVNFTPEFPRSAELMSAFWERQYGQIPDAVVSVDPVALGYMLEDMPATDVDGITITGANLADVMLRDSYLLFPQPADQDEFFAHASEVLFGQLLGGPSAVTGVERAVQEGRFLVWSPGAHQDLLETTSVSGDFIAQTDALGVFVNDGSGSKIGYYVDRSTEVVDHVCGDGSLRAQTVTMTLTHSYAGDVADLPWYVSGGGIYVPEGEFQANVLVYPPAGLGLVEFLKDGKQDLMNPESHDGRPVITSRVALLPGESAVLTFELEATEPDLVIGEAVGTPGPSADAIVRSRVTFDGVC
ncbi:DUF4012 domain-containing protein [Demequina aurantiaca]|uniref:DUF4012 domain-containing protein n=1 Tax=Demequina aurantiaca TaxID=676200 RepID=UPI003D32BCAE